MRNLYAFLAGGLFGAGLLTSGMTDTRKVQGWLDIFGDWDPTLAFVMGGAILPMAVAWQLTRNRRPLMGGAFPAPPEPRLGRSLVIGSVMFGMGWGLTGLCPGPAVASTSFGGTEGLVFLAAMISGMALAPIAKRRLDAVPAAA
jgi:hypothetical protein